MDTRGAFSIVPGTGGWKDGEKMDVKTGTNDERTLPWVTRPPTYFETPDPLVETTPVHPYSKSRPFQGLPRIHVKWLVEGITSNVYARPTPGRHCGPPVLSRDVLDLTDTTRTGGPSFESGE